MKVDETDNKKGNSKNAACNAKISIRIKSTSRRLKKDPLMKVIILPSHVSDVK